MSEFSRHVHRYMQCHLAKTAGPFGIPGDYDGVAELWFDSVESATAAFREPKYLEIIRPDEQKFLDLQKCISFVSSP